MIEELLKYTSSYKDAKNLVTIKLEHSLRVYENSLKIAESLELNKEDTILASVIGLLHDIGRFEQIKRFKSLKPNKDFDHGEYGANILINEGLIEKFYDKKEDYPIIDFAIRNHNKLKIESCSDERKMMFARLIRDADKIDIIYHIGTIGDYLEKEDESDISKEVLKAIEKHTLIDRKHVKTNNDIIANRFAFAFDLNYDYSYILFRKYLEAYYDRVKKNDAFSNIYNDVRNFLDERIEKEC